MITLFWDVFSVLWCVSKASWRHLLPQSSLWTLKDVGCRFLLNVGTYLLDCKLSWETLKLWRVWVWKLLSLRLWWSVMWLKFMDVSEKNIYGINPFYPDYIGDMFCRNVGVVLPRCMTSCYSRRYSSYWNLTNLEIFKMFSLIILWHFSSKHTWRSCVQCIFISSELSTQSLQNSPTHIRTIIINIIAIPKAVINEHRIPCTILKPFFIVRIYRPTWPHLHLFCVFFKILFKCRKCSLWFKLFSERSSEILSMSLSNKMSHIMCSYIYDYLLNVQGCW